MDNRPLEHRDLVAYFEAGYKTASQWAVGVEWEKFVLQSADLAPLPVHGALSRDTLLVGFAGFGWKPLYDGGQLAGMARGKANLKFEPGGQLELSGEPHAQLRTLGAELDVHVREVREVARRLGLTTLSVGVDPLHTEAEVPWSEKPRYVLMRKHFERVGGLGTHMMKLTCTMQASYDFADEEDACAKLAAAFAFAPVLTALFAHSPWAAGADTGRQSHRSHIWTRTDDARCGVPAFVERRFRLADYVEWALDVPMFLVRRGANTLEVPPELTFRRFLAEGHAGERATLTDWETHLTTLFPEARLKQVIELRSADAGPTEMALALAAFGKGLLYSADARAEAQQRVAALGKSVRTLFLEVGQHGLALPVADGTLRSTAAVLVRLAAQGLASLGAADEARHLAVLERIAAGESLTDELRRRLRSAGNDPARVRAALLEPYTVAGAAGF